MRRPAFLLAALVGAGVLALPASAREPHERLLKEKADLVVSVKFTLQVSMNRGGQTMDREVPSSGTGILVDKNGLVMISNDSLNPFRSMMRGMSGGGDVKSTPSNFRVTFPGETKEYAAILGATESKLGLAFVRIRDLEGKEIHSLADEPGTEPGAGDRLYGVSRLGEGFDHAPYVDELRVSGRIAKPRDLINVEGDFINLAHPVFDEKGSVVGVIISQQGVGDSGSGVFVLPWKVASGTIQRALKASDTALEEAKAKDAEKPADAPADATDEPADKPDDKPADKPSDKPADKPEGDGTDGPSEPEKPAGP